MPQAGLFTCKVLTPICIVVSNSLTHTVLPHSIIDPRGPKCVHPVQASEYQQYSEATVEDELGEYDMNYGAGGEDEGGFEEA